MNLDISKLSIDELKTFKKFNREFLPKIAIWLCLFNKVWKPKLIPGISGEIKPILDLNSSTSLLILTS